MISALLALEVSCETQNHMRAFHYLFLSLLSLVCFSFASIFFFRSSPDSAPSIGLGAGQLCWNMLSQLSCHLLLALSSHQLEHGGPPCFLCRLWPLEITAQRLSQPPLPHHPPALASHPPSLPSWYHLSLPVLSSPSLLVLLRIFPLLEGVNVRGRALSSVYQPSRWSCREPSSPILLFFFLTVLMYGIVSFFLPTT